MDPTSSPIETVNAVALYALVKLWDENTNPKSPPFFSDCFEPQRLQALQLLPRDDPCGRIPQTSKKEAGCDPESPLPHRVFFSLASQGSRWRSMTEPMGQRRFACT